MNLSITVCVCVCVVLRLSIHLFVWKNKKLRLKHQYASHKAAMDDQTASELSSDTCCWMNLKLWVQQFLKLSKIQQHAHNRQSLSKCAKFLRMLGNVSSTAQVSVSLRALSKWLVWVATDALKWDCYLHLCQSVGVFTSTQYSVFLPIFLKRQYSN